MILIYITLAITIFAIFNGLVISWAHSSGKERLFLSKLWHILGRVLIGVIALWEWYNLKDLSLLTGIVFALTTFNVSWTIWDLTINLVRSKIGLEPIKILHTDTNGINAFIVGVIHNTGFWVLRLLLIIANIILLWM